MFDQNSRQISASVSAKPARKVRAGSMTLGGPAFTVIAGPCSIESKEQFSKIAHSVKNEGATVLRGGIFKMRTNPDSFQGLGKEGLEIAKEIKSETGLPITTEITDPRQIELLNDTVDIFQVGSRNMYNYALLKELGRLDKPVLLKRGFSALIDEWLLAADYIVQGGNENVVLCERGIRSFDQKTRNTLDLAAVAYVKQNSSFPVIVDPSHATGRPELIEPMALASAAAGADGIMVEVHHQPELAKSDGFQALTLENFTALMNRLKPILQTLDRPLEMSTL